MRILTNNRRGKEIFGAILLVLLCNFLFTPVLLAQELKDLLRQNRRMTERDPLGNEAYDWPAYSWKSSEINFSQVFSGRVGAKLPLMWLGEPGDAYIMRPITAKVSTQHLVLERKVVQTLSRGGNIFLLRVYVPHPTAEDWARMKVLEDYKKQLPLESEVFSITPLNIQGYEANFFAKNAEDFNCNLTVQLPRMVLVSIRGSCRSKALIVEIMNLLNFERLVSKINS